MCHTRQRNFENFCHGNHYKQFLYKDRINYLPFNLAEKTLLQHKYKIHIKLCYHSNYNSLLSEEEKQKRVHRILCFQGLDLHWNLIYEFRLHVSTNILIPCGD